MRTLVDCLRIIEDDERVDFHTRYKCGEAAAEIERLRSALDKIARGYLGDQTAEQQFIWAQDFARASLMAS